jgi:hypothetical protein
MAALAELRASDGFRVETPRGPLGVVEDVWLGEQGEAQALAVRTVDGRHALLLREDVEAVLTEEHQIVVDRPRLLELAAPQMERAETDGGSRLAASWATTGDLLPLPAPPPLRLPFRSQPSAAEGERPETPLWKMVAVLWSGIAFLAASVIGLVFLIAVLTAGHAY